MDTQALSKAREEVAALEAKMLEEVTAKAEMLGYTLSKANREAAPKVKRARRTKAQIAADNGTV